MSLSGLCTLCVCGSCWQPRTKQMLRACRAKRLPFFPLSGPNLWTVLLSELVFSCFKVLARPVLRCLTTKIARHPPHTFCGLLGTPHHQLKSWGVTEKQTTPFWISVSWIMLISCVFSSTVFKPNVLGRVRVAWGKRGCVGWSRICTPQ